MTCELTRTELAILADTSERLVNHLSLLTDELLKAELSPSNMALLENITFETAWIVRWASEMNKKMQRMAEDVVH